MINAINSSFTSWMYTSIKEKDCGGNKVEVKSGRSERLLLLRNEYGEKLSRDAELYDISKGIRLLHCLSINEENTGERNEENTTKRNLGEFMGGIG